MKEVRELLHQARYAIDGGVRFDSPEYAALDALERALALLVERVQEIAPEIK